MFTPEFSELPSGTATEAARDEKRPEGTQQIPEFIWIVWVLCVSAYGCVYICLCLWVGVLGVCLFIAVWALYVCVCLGPLCMCVCLCLCSCGLMFWVCVSICVHSYVCLGPLCVYMCIRAFVSMWVGVLCVCLCVYLGPVSVYASVCVCVCRSPCLCGSVPLCGLVCTLCMEEEMREWEVAVPQTLSPAQGSQPLSSSSLGWQSPCLLLCTPLSMSLLLSHGQRKIIKLWKWLLIVSGSCWLGCI